MPNWNSLSLPGESPQPPSREHPGFALLLVLALVMPACDGARPAYAPTSGPEAAALGTSRQPSPLRLTADGTLYVEGELLIRFREGVGPVAAEAFRAEQGVSLLHTFKALPGLHVMRLPKGVDVERALAEYQADPRVLYVGRNNVYSLDSTQPNDPQLGALWGLRNAGQEGGIVGADIRAVEAWGVTQGHGSVVLAILDTGIDYTHEDLAANVWINPGEIAGNGVDDDVNGYIDDVHGLNAITGSGDPMDDNNHGTHVAGTLGAVGNNGLGVVGVNWDVKIVSCKFLDRVGNGTEADALKCLDYLLGLKTRAENPVSIVASNNSWSCRTRGCNSPAMREAIARHLQAGMLFVAAAGNLNANIDVADSWPAKHPLPNILAVAATTRTDAKLSLSNYGRQTVHLGAPGGDILSTVPGNAYRSFSGTSMAAPHVTGVAGLLAAQEPGRDWRAIKNLLLASGQRLPGLAATTLTGRRLSAWGADGTGALTCTNQRVTRRLQPVVPIAGRLTTPVGVPVPLEVLNIDCATPAGAVDVTVEGAVLETLHLLDGGAGGDVVGSDGVYSARFTPKVPGSYTLSFPDGGTITVEAYNTYQPAEQRPSSYEQLTSANVRVDEAADETVSVITPPFPLPFADLQPGFSALYVASNGYISFSPTVSASLNTPLPSSFFQSALIPYWQNLEVPGLPPSGLYHETLGSAPARRFVLEWRDVIISSTYPTAPLKFQVVFFEGSSDIQFNYADVVYGDPDLPELDLGGSATVGIQTLPASIQQYSHMQSVLSNGLSLLFRTQPVQGVPVVTPPRVTTPAPEQGSPVTLAASFSDSDAQGGPWKVQWDCDHDGAGFTPEVTQFIPQEGAVTATCRYPNDGTYTVALRVTSQTGVNSQLRSITFGVADVHPKLLMMTATPDSGDEPVAVSFEVNATPGAADGQSEPIIDYQWDFDGDGTFEATTAEPRAQHEYRNNPAQAGTFMARVRVRDQDSFSDGTRAVVVRNVAPVIAPALVDRTVLEGSPFEFQVSAVDPGVLDTLRFSLVEAPEGMAISSAGLITWTPSYSQSFKGEGQAHRVTVNVADEGATSPTASFMVLSRWKDTDGDGMADAWERGHGCEPERNDAREDVDRDGIINLDAFNNETGGPYTPALVSPRSPDDSAGVDTRDVVLTAAQTTDRDTRSSELRYVFELYSDKELRTQVKTVTVPAPTEGDAVTATFGTAADVVLLKNRSYWWRVRATDGERSGAWSAARSFRYVPGGLPEGEKPGIPKLVSPSPGEILGEAVATFTLENVSQVEGAAIAYDFEVYESTSATVMLMATMLGVPEQAGGRTSFTLVEPQLRPGESYFWRARAVSTLGGAGDWTEPVQFQMRGSSGRGEGKADGCSAMPGTAAASHLLLLLTLMFQTRLSGSPEGGRRSPRRVR